MRGFEFISGYAMATFAFSGIFFLKIWRMSRDRFYLLFCIACLLLAVERIVLFVISDPAQGLHTPLTEGASWVYLMRLSSFLVICIAILDKNYGARKPK